MGSWRDSAQNKIAQNHPFGVIEPKKKNSREKFRRYSLTHKMTVMGGIGDAEGAV